MPRSRGENVHWPLHRAHSSRSNAKRRIANPIPIRKPNPFWISSPPPNTTPLPLLLHITASITRNNKAKMASGATMCCTRVCVCVCTRRFVSVLSLKLFLLFYTIFIWKANQMRYTEGERRKKWTFTAEHKYLVYGSCCCMFILLYLMRFLNFSSPKAP